ncbi:hypothetical protein NMG60_11020326 [Bertholletia excelsa]
MEGNTGNSLSKEKCPLEGPTSDSETKRSAENNASTSIFINHAATTWQKNRREWIGDQSRRMKRMPKDPIISWSTSYEDLLCTEKPFPEPIPLPAASGRLPRLSDNPSFVSLKHHRLG